MTVKHGPNRVVAATDTSHPAPRAPLPSGAAVGRLQQLFAVAEAEQKLRQSGLDPATHMNAAVRASGPEGEAATSRFVREILPPGVAVPGGGRLIRGRLYVYRYDANERLPKHEAVPPETAGAPDSHQDPVLPLPPVPASIKDGQYYTVAEVTFELGIPGNEKLVWLALVEIETNAVLYLRALASGVNGLVFKVDPITQSGNAANSPDKSNAVLNPFRGSVVLPNLNAPVGGTQSLTGSRAAVLNVEGTVVALPTKPTGINFDYNVRTDDFAAVNAYYHVDKFFQTVESLGFPLATYFNATTFPLPADHRDMNSVNAHCIGNGVGGIGHVGYGLNDETDVVNPIGRACDSRVTWHELGGHGILYEHVNSANFGFAHSAGDSLSVIFHDPESKAPDRFRYAPWNPINLRRCDRDVAAGWAWGGSQDVGGYPSEEILETTMFRVYRSIGGDSTTLARRKFASRMTMYLILRAVGQLTPGTNPGNALGFANKLIEVDLLNWTTEGIFGGAYNKVIRWSFEKQGLYQPPGAPTPVAKPGAPPAVDVYIDDGRAGEYQYQPVHWNTTTIWNRRKADGGLAHQKAKLNKTNFAYVRIKNRGTTTAKNVRVKGYHCKPSAGVSWPNDLQPMATAEIVVGSLLGNNAQEKIVGPFEWVPINNAWGHDCMFMIVSRQARPEQRRPVHGRRGDPGLAARSQRQQHRPAQRRDHRRRRAGAGQAVQGIDLLGRQSASQDRRHAARRRAPAMARQIQMEAGFCRSQGQPFPAQARRNPRSRVRAQGRREIHREGRREHPGSRYRRHGRRRRDGGRRHDLPARAAGGGAAGKRVGGPQGRARKGRKARQGAGQKGHAQEAPVSASVIASEAKQSKKRRRSGLLRR